MQVTNIKAKTPSTEAKVPRPDSPKSVHKDEKIVREKVTLRGKEVEVKIKPDIPDDIQTVVDQKVSARFAVDGNRNVVLRFIDDEGRVVKQIPPEEMIELAKRMEQYSKKLYSKLV